MLPRQKLLRSLKLGTGKVFVQNFREVSASFAILKAFEDQADIGPLGGEESRLSEQVSFVVLIDCNVNAQVVILSVNINKEDTPYYLGKKLIGAETEVYK